MAAQLPDPRDFKGWEDAFQYPLPAVRKLEQQLRSNAVENRERLRTLVGASYRDLLGTAERICEMDEKMQLAETTLGLTAKKCNSVAVDKIFSNFSTLDTGIQANKKRQNSAAAQLAILRSCHSTISAVLQKEGSTYLAAKVLVLARLLHKTLSQSPDASPLVDSLRNRLAYLRTRLLRHIDRSFSNPEIEIPKLVENMCALSLATSSTPTDVLRHFLHIRLEVIRSGPEAAQHMRKGLLKAIKLFKGSLIDSQTIFPRRLAESLSRLKLQPLLQDKEIQTLPDLNLDIHGRWIAGEVRNFTPWPRHDELQKSEAEKILRHWAPAALKSLKEAAQSMLSEQEDFADVVKLREDVLEVHLSSNPRIAGVQSSDVLELLRDVFNERLQFLVQKRADGLAALLGGISSAIDPSASTYEGQQASTWQLAHDPTTLENGAFAFKDAISDRFHGNEQATKKCLSIAEKWATSIIDMRSLIKTMREKRWEDDVLDATSEADDDLDLDSRQALLSEDDPRELNDALDSALQSSFARFGEEFRKIAAVAGASTNTTQSIFLLRVLRQFAQKTIDLTSTSSAANGKFQGALDIQGLSSPLYASIVTSVSQSSLQSFERSLSRFTNNPFHGNMLWEGHPPLPVQPTPSCFRLPYCLVKGMATLGQDLWAPGLVEALKQHMDAEARKLLDECLSAVKALPELASVDSTPVSDPSEDAEPQQEADDSSDGLANGAGIDGPNDSSITHAATNGAVEGDSGSKTAKLIQLLFDAMYLQRVLHVPNAKVSDSSRLTLSNQSYLEELAKELDLETEKLERMRKNAVDYWKRTYLLLGLLS
ncbi:hypothetical protein NA57DRAFT_41876 [Rhizodiscina lignyota]|uniref:Conserved oligomeric Golgi complex subunit 1 n=1 Tax=Rhizodiscina lignyota TaxID=1504668 RepID=A0A9P4M780_9PEZI|nr:hypothetical protein NA57DRAFT_41876 [Rhizodiscina lignyota]